MFNRQIISKYENEKLYDLLEAVADIAYEMGHRRLRLSNDSREKIGKIIEWAKEFAQTHQDTDWGQGNYIETVDKFTDAKLRGHFVNIDRSCPHCQSDASLHCEFVADEADYFSVQCCLCGQFWEGIDALTAISGVKKWEKEMLGEDARAVLKTLLLDIEPNRQLYGRLEHPKALCRGVYQDAEMFVAFDNSHGECFVEEFNMLNTAVLWIRGYIQASERFKYE